MSTNFVIDTVEEARNYWENGGLQGFHVIWQQSDVTLEESHSGPSTVHHCLQDQTTSHFEKQKHTQEGCSISFIETEIVNMPL